MKTGKPGVWTTPVNVILFVMATWDLTAVRSSMSMQFGFEQPIGKTQ